MKNTKLNLSIASLALMFPLLLTSCDNGATLPSYEPGKEDLNAILNVFEKGFTMNGEVHQGKVVVDLNDPSTAQSEEQVYNVVGLYENSDERIGTSITHLGKIGELETVIDQTTAYADDQGYAYKEYLDYKNEVQRSYLKDRGNKLSFAASGLYNFFATFNPSDFVYDDVDHVYNLDIGKTNIFLKNILGHVNSGFFFKPEYAKLKVENSLFSTLDIKISDYQTVKFEENTMVGTVYSNSVKFTFENVGTTKLPRVTAYEAKPENAELKTALSKIDKNMTIDVLSALSIDKGAINRKYKMYKYTGDELLVQYYNEPIEKDLLIPSNHFVLKKLENSASDLLYCHVMQDDNETYEKGEHRYFAKNYQGIYYYEDLLPAPSKISTDFFTYDPNSNEYICEDSSVVDQLKPLLTINEPPLSDEHALNANKLGIRLDDNGNLDYIKFYVNYKNLFNNSEIEGFIKASFSEIGSTSL